METTKQAFTAKKVIIFGASSGIGLAVAQAVSAAGAEVTMISGNASRLDEALKTLPSGTEGYTVDLGKEENIRSFFEQAGQFDHLVYTAGEYLLLGHLADTNLAASREFFNVRYWGAVAAVKYGASHLLPGGSIVLTSGTAGTRPGSGWSLGASICGAMEGFTRAMAVELAPIRVNIVLPGLVKTNLWNSMGEEGQQSLYADYAQKLLVKKVAEASDIAEAYLYFMKQSYATGQTHIVDGGGVLI